MQQHHSSSQNGLPKPTEDSFVSISVTSDTAFDDITDPAFANSARASVAGCLPLALPSSSRPSVRATLPAHRLRWLESGQSQLRRAPANASAHAVPPFSYQQADSALFQLRQKGYTRNKVKAPSRPEIYELASADLYQTNSKHFHIVKRLRLPDAVNSARTANGQTMDEVNIPPLLVLHIMMPMYPGTLFPTTDGPNVSFIYYFRLPADFDPATFHTPEVCCAATSCTCVHACI